MKKANEKQLYLRIYKGCSTLWSISPNTQNTSSLTPANAVNALYSQLPPCIISSSPRPSIVQQRTSVTTILAQFSPAS
jgi:hypothetical protein